MTALLFKAFGFIKGLKIETILFGVVTIVCVLALIYSASLRKSLKAAEADLALEQYKRRQAEQQLVDAQEKFDQRLNSIKALETSRKTNRIEIEPFVLRLDELTRKDANAPDNSFVDRLNGINADLNRMWEHNGR